MNKKLLITGSGGQLATEYQLSTPIDGWEYEFLTRTELDITNIESVRNACKNIDCVLNLAAYTNVEKAEKEDTELAFKVNTEGPKNLAVVCHEKNVPLIHISTDFVFDGEKSSAYTENDIENPINQYGATKFLGEKWVQENHDWYYIIRTSWVYSNNARNFFTTMLKLSQERNDISIIADQYGSPTSTKELCRALDSVLGNLDKSLSGVYHFAGIGKTSWKNFAEEIFFQSKIYIEVKAISSKTWKSEVKRPNNSYLSSVKFIEAFGYTPAHWKNALKEIISSRKIMPVKVGDIVAMDTIDAIVVSTDWIKRTARIATTTNTEKSIELSFESLQVYEKK